MDISVINLVSEDESSLSEKKLKNVSSSRKRVVRSKSLGEGESKQKIKKEIKKTPPRKRLKKEQLVSPNTKKPKFEHIKTSKTISEVETEGCMKKENKFPVKKLHMKDECSSLGSTDKLHFGEDWQIEDVIAEKLQIPIPIVKNITRLFSNENTIPFIARYRKEQTGNMEPEALRRVKDNYERLISVKQKIDSVATSISNMNKMTPEIASALHSSRTMNEIEHVYTQFKPSRATLADRARALGLEEAAMTMLEGNCVVCPENLVNSKTESEEKVLLGLQHIIADVINKNKLVLDTMRDLCTKNKSSITIESKKKKLIDLDKKMKSVVKKRAVGIVDEHLAEKFHLYFSFISPITRIRPHQVLAILRGESMKILSVKFNTPDWFFTRIKETCYREWLCKGMKYETRDSLLKKSIEYSYTRLLLPHMNRQIRSDLMEEAHQASIEVFSRNLKHLLLIPPLRGKVIMGIDPGFKNGCKLAVINGNGEVLETNIISILNQNHGIFLLKSLLHKHNCELIALGNGMACRETETLIAASISEGFFKPLDVKYTIIDEQGVSIYSCSPVAKQEFPYLEPNLISAVSLARRIQDPLSELVKVEPKHLGVGMYQHDIPEKKLSSALDEVVVECVSFVGVDVNTASDIILRHISGLSASKAKNIIEWRIKNGPFLNRDQLHLVKGIGPKSFEQCAGFLRIVSQTSTYMTFGDLKDDVSSSKSKKKTVCESSPNPLDQTWIHPESYATVYWLLELCGLQLSEFGSPHFATRIQSKVNEMGFSKIASNADISEERLKLIVDGLNQKSDYDYRSQFHKPLFRSSICSVKDLKIGSIVTGRVQNVTHFGAFIDVGVGRDGLLHVSQMKNETLQVGTRVEVSIINIDEGPKSLKISLSLVRII